MSVENLHKVYFEMCEFFKEREEPIKLLLLAILSKQNAYFLGSPGTGKSAMARAVASHFGAKYFEILMTRFTPPEEVFGPVDLVALEKGEYRRNTVGRLPEAEIAFIDEVFKANSAILNALLSIINERIYHDGGMVIKVPLITLITASNELPEDENELAALYDRLLIRCVVDYIKDDKNFREMLLDDEKYTPKTKISIDELKAMHKQVASVDVTPILDSIVDIRKKLRNEGIVASDRRFKQAINVIKAHAYFHGRNTATVDDLRVLQHILWDTPEQIRTVRSVIMEVVDPFAKKIMEYKEILADYESKLRGHVDPQEVQEIMTKIKVIENEVKELINVVRSSGRDPAELEEILDRIQTLKLSMIDKVF